MPRPRSQPPAKFAFLSGIHPDLDDALCEADCNSHSRSHSNLHTHQHLRPHSYYEDASRPRSRRSSAGMSASIGGHANSIVQSTHYFEEEIHKQNRRRSSGSNSFYDTRYESSQSIATTSRPRVSTCNLNESIDSVPFSNDGMERAKRKIKSQAARIRELEGRLERNASLGNIGSARKFVSDETDTKVLSPGERLEAHKERKKMDNKYKEESGKWKSPESVQKQSISKKVKRRDEFVDRLAAGPTERRRQDEVKAKISRSIRKRNEGIDNYPRDSSPLVRRKSLEEELRSLSTKKKKKRRERHLQKNAEGRESLMRRLNMGVEERRGTKSDSAVLDASRRVTSKREQRPPHPLYDSCIEDSSQYDANEARDAANVSRISSRRKSQGSKRIKCIRCQTCGSTEDCEEDSDDPNIFYCSICWEEYEDGSNLDQGFEQDDDEESHTNSMKASSAVDFDRALWILHDNPNLGSRLICSGPKKMSCFVETKDPKIKNCVRIMHATIDYSGPVVNSGGRTIRNIEETDRGAECIRLGNIWGFVIHHDKVPTRLSQNKSVHQFQLDTSDALQLTGSNAQMTVKDFLKGCVGAVDVILDPQSSSGGWYPIREANSSRKIAPQFRSKGIGYIRLGDDMGNNGQAFVSDDCCKTFLFNESVQREELNSDLLRTVSSFSSKPSYRSRSPRSQSSSGKSQNFKSRKHRESQTTDSNTLTSRVCKILSEDEDDSSISSHNSDSSQVLSAGEILKDLQNMEGSKDMKWKEKAELLIKLGKAVGKPQGRSWCDGALNYIQDLVSAKNVNIHVLRSALSVVEKIGHVLEEDLPNHIAWRTIMIELLKLLKNKQCGGGAREILQKLHGKCYTLVKSLAAISHVLGISKTLSTSQRKISFNKKSHSKRSNRNSNSSNKSGAGSAAPAMNANSVEVIEWLAVTTESERLLGEINPPMEESDLELLATFFLSHESHRDARCRKNALDGLLHTMLYGVDVLGMDVEDAKSICEDLKTSKPKAWTRLMKSLSAVLKAERSNLHS